VAQEQQQIPFKIRLKAWWEGYDPADLMRLHGAADAGPAFEPPPGIHPADEKPEPVVAFSESHIEFLELAWGQGFSGPNSEEFILDLAKPLGLGPEHTVLEIGAGLGGGTRAIAKSFGVWIEGMEANATLAEQGMERSVRAGLGERAPIRHYDPEALDFPESRYDAVFSKESIYRVADKERMFNALTGTLKPGGQLLFTDFIAAAGAEDAALKAWRDSEPESPNLGDVDEISQYLSGSGLNIRICEDISERYQRVVLGEWARLLGRVQRREVSPRWHNYLTAVTELEQNRMAALDDGSLRVYRFHSYK
jgi:cyclopropane fatty-acyl-phospholipid synthase-like methyltransferase